MGGCLIWAFVLVCFITNSESIAQNSSIDNEVASSGILSSSKGHRPSLIHKAFNNTVGGIEHATEALVGATVLNNGIDLAPDDATNPEWPFREPRRKTLYTVEWTDGSIAKVSRLPDGSLQVLGSGHYMILQPESGGTYAIMGNYGSMGTLMPRMDGGYTLMKDDGSCQQILPQEDGSMLVKSQDRVLATIIPGPAGTHHIIGSQSHSSALLH